jgi:hypothetical protein
MTTAGRPPTQLGYISEAISRISSVPGVTAKKSVFKEAVNSRSEISARGSQCEVKTLLALQCVVI